MIKSRDNAVKRARIIAGLTQIEVAEKINLNPASFCLIENGKLGLKPKTAKSICEFFGVGFDDLFAIIDKT